MKTYTKEQIIEAAKLGEINVVDAEHIVSLLDEVANPTPVQWLRNALYTHLSQKEKEQYEGLFQQALEMESDKKNLKLKSKVCLKQDHDVTGKVIAYNENMSKNIWKIKWHDDYYTWENADDLTVIE